MWNRWKQTEPDWKRLEQTVTSWNRLKRTKSDWNKLKKTKHTEIDFIVYGWMGHLDFFSFYWFQEDFFAIIITIFCKSERSEILKGIFSLFQFLKVPNTMNSKETFINFLVLRIMRKKVSWNNHEHIISRYKPYLRVYIFKEIYFWMVHVIALVANPNCPIRAITTLSIFKSPTLFW